MENVLVECAVETVRGTTNYIPIRILPADSKKRPKLAAGCQFCEVPKSSLNYKYCMNCGSVYADLECCAEMKLWVPEPAPHEIQVSIFHGGCSDGHGADWSVHYYFCERFGCNTAVNTVRSHGVRHADYDDSAANRSKLNDLYKLVTGKCVIISDFAFNSDITLEIKKRCTKFILLDHHDSNQKMLETEPNCYFSMDNSGAYLTWAYMQTGKPLQQVQAPALIRYIQDKDLWRFTEPNSKDVATAIYIDGRNNLKNFDTIHKTESEAIPMLMERGAHYRTYEERIIEPGIKFGADIRTFLGHKAAVLNTSLNPSETAEFMMLQDKYKDCRIFIIWKWQPNQHKYQMHLRRRESDNEIVLGDLCVALAKQWPGATGGGHPASSGFALPDSESIDALFSQTDRTKYYIQMALQTATPAQTELLKRAMSA